MGHLVTGAETKKAVYYNQAFLKSRKSTVGERTVALEIIACYSITQTPTGQWNINNVSV